MNNKTFVIILTVALVLIGGKLGYNYYVSSLDAEFTDGYLQGLLDGREDLSYEIYDQVKPCGIYQLPAQMDEISLVTISCVQLAIENAR